MKKVDLNKNYKRRVVLNDTTWQAAHDFALVKWKERAADLGWKEPSDLSNGCKFSSLFVQRIFGGFLSGNERHIFNEIEGKTLDLNANSKDVLTMDEPYEDDGDSIYHPDYIDSLESCLPRVNDWIKGFLTQAKQNYWVISQNPLPTNPEP